MLPGALHRKVSGRMTSGIPFASLALALGETLPVIGKLLGHRDIKTTARYAHLAREPIYEAAERVAGTIAADIL